MKVTRAQIVARGLTNRCPNCGGHTLFRAGTLFEVNAECPNCGLKIERDEGFFLGSLSLNYGVTLVCFLTPVLLLWYYDVLGDKLAIACDGCVQGQTATISFIATDAEFTPPVIYSRESRAKLVTLIEARPDDTTQPWHPGQPIEASLMATGS